MQEVPPTLVPAMEMRNTTFKGQPGAFVLKQLNTPHMPVGGERDPRSKFLSKLRLLTSVCLMAAA